MPSHVLIAHEGNAHCAASDSIIPRCGSRQASLAHPPQYLTVTLGLNSCSGRENCNIFPGRQARTEREEVSQSSQTDKGKFKKKTAGEYHALVILIIFINWLMLVI
jgi:hypothetical protein